MDLRRSSDRDVTHGPRIYGYLAPQSRYQDNLFEGVARVTLFYDVPSMAVRGRLLPGAVLGRVNRACFFREHRIYHFQGTCILFMPHATTCAPRLNSQYLHPELTRGVVQARHALAEDGCSNSDGPTDGGAAGGQDTAQEHREAGESHGQRENLAIGGSAYAHGFATRVNEICATCSVYLEASSRTYRGPGQKE